MKQFPTPEETEREADLRIPAEQQHRQRRRAALQGEGERVARTREGLATHIAMGRYRAGGMPSRRRHSRLILSHTELPPSSRADGVSPPGRSSGFCGPPHGGGRVSTGAPAWCGSGRTAWGSFKMVEVVFMYTLTSWRTTPSASSSPAADRRKGGDQHPLGGMWLSWGREADHCTFPPCPGSPAASQSERERRTGASPPLAPLRTGRGCAEFRQCTSTPVTARA